MPKSVAKTAKAVSITSKSAVAAGSGSKAAKAKKAVAATNQSAEVQVTLLNDLQLHGEQLGLLRCLFSNCASLVVGKLHGGFSGALVVSTQGFDGRGLPDEPTVTKLDYKEAMEAESLRANGVRAHLGSSAPAVLRGPLFAESFAAVVLECAGACWVLPQFYTTLEEAGGRVQLISTYRDLLQTHFDASLAEGEISADGRTDGRARRLVRQQTTVVGEDALLAVLDELWNPGGPLRQLAVGTATPRALRGPGGVASESLFLIAGMHSTAQRHTRTTAQPTRPSFYCAAAQYPGGGPMQQLLSAVAQHRPS